MLEGFMVPHRLPTVKEMKLIKALVDKASLELPPDWDISIRVCPMEDGGMGGLSIAPEKCMIGETRNFGRQVSEIQFLDRDGVLVIASLYVDECEKLYELDMWKVDYSNLIDLP